jgi:pectinesterase
MKHKIFASLGLLLLLSAFTSVEKRPITIFMIGDSTMANKDLHKGNPERGWGQMLPEYFSKEIRIDNHARNGRSSKSFIDEGLWEKVRSSIHKGDYVFIEFGHNDEKPKADRHTDPGTTFDANLRRFVEETRAQGGIPILFNSIVRRNFAPAVDGQPAKLIDTHGAYLDSPRNVAKELNVPFVDLNGLTRDLVEGLGPEGSKKLFMWIAPGTVELYPKGREDNTHLNVYGGRVVAGLAAEAVVKAVPALSKYMLAGHKQ